MRRCDVVAHEIDGEAVLYDAARHEALYLNAPAWIIWQGADGAASVDELAGRHAAATQSSATESVAHARHAVEALIRNGWMDWAEPTRA